MDRGRPGATEEAGGMGPPLWKRQAPETDTQVHSRAVWQTEPALVVVGSVRNPCLGVTDAPSASASFPTPSPTSSPKPAAALVAFGCRLLAVSNRSS